MNPENILSYLNGEDLKTVMESTVCSTEHHRKTAILPVSGDDELRGMAIASAMRKIENPLFDRYRAKMWEVLVLQRLLVDGHINARSFGYAAHYVIGDMRP